MPETDSQLYFLTKNVDVAGGHSATTRTKSMDLSQEKAYTNCENDL